MKLTDEDYIFRRKGEALPMTPSSFTWRFKLILKKHGLPENLNVHSLRHTNASLLIAGGTDVTTVAGLLGHAQPSTTLDIYSHAFDKNKREASRALQGIFSFMTTDCFSDIAASIFQNRLPEDSLFLFSLLLNAYTIRPLPAQGSRRRRRSQPGERRTASRR